MNSTVYFQYIYRIEAGMDSIHDDIKLAEKELKSMQKSRRFIKFWKRKVRRNNEDIWKNGLDDGEIGSVSSIHTDHKPQRGSLVTKITNNDQEIEMENNMQQVSSMIENLHHIAVDIGVELENQNKQLDRLNCKGESNVKHVKIVNKITRNMLYK